MVRRSTFLGKADEGRLAKLNRRLFWGWAFLGFPAAAFACWASGFDVIVVLLVNLFLSAYAIALEHWVAFQTAEG